MKIEDTDGEIYRERMKLYKYVGIHTVGERDKGRERKRDDAEVMGRKMDG